MAEFDTKKAKAHDFVDGPSTWLEGKVASRTLATGSASEDERFPERLGHYTLGTRLGSGGFGVVFRATDERNGDEVALKILRSFDAETALTLKDEFRALSEIRHKNLVRLLELGLDDGVWFFTMELVKGIDIISFIRSERGGPVKLPRLRVALAQLALALEATHSAGFLHLDIKPSNILVSEEGRVVLLDFGLVESLDRHQQTFSSRLQGTPAYMAPEQIVGEALGRASDWYAFGGILYEALSGSLPFDSSEPAEMMARKLSESAVPDRPLCFDDSEAKDLGQLALALLNREPLIRPDGAAVQRSLRLGKAPRQSFFSPLVGRDEEMKFLESAYRAAHDARVVVRVSGPSGIGKSTILRAFLSAVRDRSSDLVLFSRCFEQADIPFRAFDGCIDELTRMLSTASLSLVHCSESAQELSRIFPALAQALNLAPGPVEVTSPVAPGDAQQRAFSELMDLLVNASNKRRLVLVFDDLQWSDDDSQRLFRRILREPRLNRLLIVASYRSDLAPGPVVASLPSTAHPLIGISTRELKVGPLSDAASMNLVKELHFEEDGQRARDLAKQAGGNPLLLEELVQTEQSEGLLENDRDHRADVEVESLILGALARLPLQARCLIELASVADRPISLELVQEAMKGDSEEVLETSKMLRRSRFLFAEGSLEPFHDRTRASVLSQLHPTTLQTRHAALASAYEVLSKGDDAALAWHHRGAGNCTEAGEYATRAAGTAASSLAFGQSAALYEQALDDLKGGSFQMLDPLRRRLAEMQGNIGRGKEAGDTYLALAEAEPSDARELRTKAASHYLGSGELSKGQEVYSGLLADAGLGFPKSRGKTIALLLVQLARLRLRGTSFRLKPDKSIPERTRIRIDLLVYGWRGYSNFKPILAGYLALSALNSALSSGYRRGIIDSLDYYALMAAYVGSPSETKRAFERLKQVAELTADTKDPLLRARVGMAYGVASSALGNFRDSVNYLDGTDPQLESFPGAYWEVAVIENTRAQSLFWLGEFSRARERVDEIARRAEQAGDVLSTLNGGVLNSMLTLAGGNSRVARSLLEEALQLWTSDEYTFESFFALKTRVWCDLYEGDSSNAAEHLREEEGRLQKSGLLGVQLVKAELAYLCGVVELACLRDERVSSRSKINGCIKTLQKIGRPYTLGYSAALKTGLALLDEEGDQAKLLSLEASGHFHEAHMLGHSATLLLSVGNSAERNFLVKEGVADPEQWRRVYQPV